MASSLDRMAGVARLEAHAVDAVAEDPAATGSALAVALGACLLAGSAGSVGETLEGLARWSATWGLWVAGIHGGARVLGLGDRLAPLFRALGFAAAPLGALALDFLPLLGGLVSAAAVLWALLAGSAAVGRVLGSEPPVSALLVAVSAGAAVLIAGLLT